MNSTSRKVVAAVVGFAFALSIFAAVGVATASAQAMSLSQLVDLFISLGIISPDKAAAAKSAVASSASSMVYSKDLTIGSTGSEVSALQAKLGVSPASGYFGSITKAAVMKYQSENGVPATGFVGPLTRAKLNAGSSSSSSSSVSTPVVNSGVEGTLTVDKASVSNTTVYEGQSMVQVLGIKLQAKLSDINIQRIKLNLGTNTSYYTKVFKTMYVTDESGKVLAQADLNSNTVVKDSGSYYLTLGGFSYNVSKDATKYLYVKADLYSSIKAQTASGCDGTGDSCSVTLPADGVRGTDGAGLDQYGPASEFSQSVTVSTSLTDSATLDLSTNSSNFKAADVVATDGSANNELDKLALLSFDLRANKDNIKVTDVTVRFTDTTDHATTTTAYLYDGSTLVQSESVTGLTAVFSDIDNLVVAKDGAAKTLTVKVDVRSADTTANALTASVAAADVTAENSVGTSVTVSGSATGESMTVTSIGPVFALVGTPSMTRTSVSSSDTTGVATSTGSANFTVSITAKGGDLKFGSTGSTTPIMATTSATFLSIYKNGASAGTVSANTAAGTSAVLSYSVPSSGVTTENSGATFVLSKNNSVQLPVTVQFTVAGSSANTYAVQINGFRWYNATVGYANSTSMTDKSEWRSSAVSLP